jgi:hypothetical protein
MTSTLPTLLSADDRAVHEWNRCKRWIGDALEYAGGSHTMDDVAQAVWSGKAQFFPLQKSAIITEIVDYPQKAMCRIWLAGGDLDELMDAEKSIAYWAKTQGCAGMEIVGRRGWSRQLKDYRQSAVVLMKDFSNE